MTPTATPVSAAAEQQHQDNDNEDQFHSKSPLKVNTSGFLQGRPPAFRNDRSIAVGTTVVVSVSVSVVIAVLLDNNRFVAISAIPIPEVFTVAIAITMTFTDGHAMRAYTDSDFFGCSGNCAANSHHGHYCYCVFDHCMLL
jgi:hypothetical protein